MMTNILTNGLTPSTSLIYELCREHHALESVSSICDNTNFFNSVHTDMFRFIDSSTPNALDRTTPQFLTLAVDYATNRATNFWNQPFSGTDQDKVSWDKHELLMDTAKNVRIVQAVMISDWRPKLFVLIAKR
jgi:hypothetical protein